MPQPSEASASSPWNRNGLIRNAIGRALHEAMQSDPSIYLFGEGCSAKMHFDAPEIEREFPDRVHTLPIAEDSSINFAVGAALLGVKPVVDVITADFLYRAMDSIANTASKLNSVLSEGESPKTIVIRSEFLTAGPTTGARPEAALVHLPGVNVAIPSTPRDAYGLTHAALRTPGVTVLFEDREIRDADTAPEDRGPFADDVPLGDALMRRSDPGARLTIVTYGLMRQRVERALAAAEGCAVEVVDLRSLYPVDWPLLLASVRRTQALLVVEPDVEYGGIGAEIVAAIVGRMRLRVAIRLGGRRITLPAATALHPLGMPTEEEILDAVRRFT